MTTQDTGYLQPIPEWLQPSTNLEAPSDTLASDSLNSLASTNALAPSSNALTSTLDNKKPKQSLLEMQFENFFEVALDRVAMGKSLRSVIENDMREFEGAAFLRWMRKDKARLERLYEAQQDAAELDYGDIKDIADGLTASALPEDVRRAELRINTRKWTAGVANRKRFGETKSIEVNQSISIRSALDRAHQRVIEGTVEEVVLDEIHSITHQEVSDGEEA